MSDPRTPRDRFALFNAIAEQLDADLIDRVEAYARKRCIMLARWGLSADPEDLTQAAIESTISGGRTWSPERYSLYHHLCGVIGGRSVALLKHARKFRRERLGLRGERGDETDPIETAASLQIPSGNPQSAMLDADLAHRTVAELLSMAEANHDKQVIAIINAYAEGITERADVAAHLGHRTV